MSYVSRQLNNGTMAQNTEQLREIDMKVKNLNDLDHLESPKFPKFVDNSDENHLNHQAISN